MNSANTQLNPLFAFTGPPNSARKNYERNSQLQQSNLNKATLKNALKDIENSEKKIKTFFKKLKNKIYPTYNESKKTAVDNKELIDKIYPTYYSEFEEIAFGNDKELIVETRKKLDGARKILSNKSAIPKIDTRQKIDPKIGYLLKIYLDKFIEKFPVIDNNIIKNAVETLKELLEFNGFDESNMKGGFKKIMKGGDEGEFLAYYAAANIALFGCCVVVSPLSLLCCPVFAILQLIHLFALVAKCFGDSGCSCVNCGTTGCSTECNISNLAGLQLPVGSSGATVNANANARAREANAIIRANAIAREANAIIRANAKKKANKPPQPPPPPPSGPSPKNLEKNRLRKLEKNQQRLLENQQREIEENRLRKVKANHVKRAEESRLKQNEKLDHIRSELNKKKTKFEKMMYLSTLKNATIRQTLSIEHNL